MLKRILNSKTNSFTFAAFLISVSAFLSGVLGLLRDRLLAGRFGAGETLDIYFAAFRIPDLVYAILIGGGIGAVFLPIFSQKHQDKEGEALEMANNILNITLFSLILISLILFIFTPFLVRFVTPGFNYEQRTKVVFLTRIMYLSPILLGLSSILSSLLQYFDRFLIYSLAPILYNLGIILGILFFVPALGISGLGLGVILGAFLHFLIQFLSSRILGYRYKPILNFKEPYLKRIFRMLVPSSIAAGISQFNLTIVTSLASTLISGSITIFNFSNNLSLLPVGLIGMPFAISFYPALSRSAKDKKEFGRNFSLAFRQILFLIIPLGVLFFLLRAQMVRLVFGTGLFGWWETRLTAASLGIFSLLIFAPTIIPFLEKAFFSLEDTKTPMILKGTTIFLNILLCSLFLSLLKPQSQFSDFLMNILKTKDIENIQVLSFPLALSLSYVFNFFCLLFISFKKLGALATKEIFQSLKKILIPTALMALSIYIILRPLALMFPLKTFLGVFLQTALSSAVGIFIYVFVSLLLKSDELNHLRESLAKR